MILVLVSYNYKTINYYIKLTATSVAIADDYDCEEKNSASKTAEEKKDKKDYSEYELLIRAHAFLTVNKLSYTRQSKLLYASTDYSLGVYSPPDPSFI